MASSLFRLSASSASLISDSLDSNEDVLKEDLFCPKSEPLCCAGVLAHDESVEPMPEPTVTVDPKLGSGLSPVNDGFCCP